ncbi:MAG: hypothetical protein [Caudoviricetes sp.]|nr:MAG: hypothetical protein [Caudoviricetes sp.]
MATQQEILQRLDTAATNAENATDAYNEVLVSEGEQDITLVDGTTTPNLNKRLKDYASSVKSVQGKTGEIKLVPSDILIMGTNKLNATSALADVPEILDVNGSRDTAANAQAQALLNRTEFLKDSISGQAEINARFINSKDGPTIQDVIDNIDTSSNVIKRGVIYFNPLDELSVQAPLNIQKMRLDLDGRNSVLKWTGTSATDAMIRVYDSSFTKIKNFILIGNATNPPLAAILFDNNSAATKGTNEKSTVQDVIVGRKYLADTDNGGSVNTGTPYGRVQYGILVQAGGYGNNDEHTFRNCAISDATVAAYSLKGDQHIWTSFENCLANASPIGYELGSNSTHYNSQSNRVTTAAYDGIRNTEHQLFAAFAEHPKMFIKSTAASFFVHGGKVLKNPTVREPLIQYVAGGVLSLKGMTIVSSLNPQFNYIDYTGGNIKQGGVFIDGCTISSGSTRNFYKIHTATVGHLKTPIDIKHGSFVFQTEYPISDETKTTQTAAANSTTVYSSVAASQLVQGKYIHSAIGADIGATAQVPVCLDTSANRVRVMNRSGTALVIPDTQIRSMDLAGHITQSNLSPATDMSFAIRGAVRVNIPLFGVRLGDYIIPTTTNIGNTYVIYGYAYADNMATVIVESISTGAVNITGGIVGAAKFTESKARFHGTYKTPALVAIAAKASTSFTINVSGAQVGSHCLVSPCADLGNLITTAHCNSDGVITVVVYNPTASSLNLNADVFFKVCAIF